MGKFDGILILGLLGIGAFVLFTDSGKQILNSLKGAINFGGYAGSYQVAAKNLPYDPNNYYLPPRDRSIAP